MISRTHTNILLFCGLLTTPPQFKSPSMTLPSIFLLLWPIKFCLKNSAVFLPNPNSQNVRLYKQEHGQPYYSNTSVPFTNLYPSYGSGKEVESSPSGTAVTERDWDTLARSIWDLKSLPGNLLPPTSPKLPQQGHNSQ